MKKKSPRAIPDFSRQSGRAASDRAAQGGTRPGAAAPPPAAPRPTVKPHATSAKSGRRGQ